MADKLKEIIDGVYDAHMLPMGGWESKEASTKRVNEMLYEIYSKVNQEIERIANKKNYAHYFDIRTNHLNEKDWRRSFSINQFLYGIILAATADGTLHNSFDEIIPLLQKEYTKNEQLTFESEWR